MRRLALLVLAAAVPALAAPRDFPVTWTTRTNEAAQSELEAWVTPRLGRTEDYARVDARLAWSVGVTRTVESQLSLDLDWERPDDVRGATLDPRVSNTWRWTTWRLGSPVGVGALSRVTLGLDRAEVEARLLLDATLGRTLFAANASAARSLFFGPGDGRIDTRLEGSAGVRYAVSKTVTFGLEARVRSAYREALFQGLAVYVGPTLTATGPGFWVALGASAQVASDKAAADKGNGEHAELRDNERFFFRVSFGLDTTTAR